MSTSQDHAKRELALIGIGGEDASAMLYILRLFFATWDSGGAVSVMAPILDKLVRLEPLSPLTGQDEEWHKPMDDIEMWQNVRCSTVFKDITRAWDINDDTNASIAFPYTPVRKDQSPIITFSSDPLIGDDTSPIPSAPGAAAGSD